MVFCFDFLFCILFFFFGGGGWGWFTVGASRTSESLTGFRAERLGLQGQGLGLGCWFSGFYFGCGFRFGTFGLLGFEGILVL